VRLARQPEEQAMTSPAAYSLYDLLRTLIERVGWPSEAEKRVALASVDAAEAMQVFGNLASQMACPHPAEAMQSGKCGDCGKQVEAQRFTARYGPQTGGGWMR
jgi:hypothetical protein